MGTRLLQSSEQFRCQPQIADTPKKFAHLSYARQLSIAFLKISTFVSKHFLNAKSCAPTALRYELGVALEHLLAEDGPVTLDAAYAQLPTITSVGMATLLPDAGQQFSLRCDASGLVPTLGEQV